MFSRLRNDVQLAVLTLFGACALLGVTPFAVYRFATGRLLAGAIDLAIVACIAGSVVHAWRVGQVQRAARFVMVTSLVGCAGIATLMGTGGLFWMYPTLLASHLLVGRKEALVASALSVGFLVVQGVLGPALEAAITARRVHGQPCGLLVLDLDHSKQVNDVHGHEAGDAVLVAFAALVRGEMREDEGFFRTGGEEFLLLLPRVDPGALAARAEQLRLSVAAQLRWGTRVVTVSGGGALLAPGEPAHAWLARADSALYQAKRAGRNRCVMDASAAHVPALLASIG